MDTEHNSHLAGAGAIADLDWSADAYRVPTRPAARPKRPPAADVQRRPAAESDAAPHALHPDDLVLPRQFFLNELRRERRRVDRSRSALSVVRFQLDSSAGNPILRMEALVELLIVRKRDSDTLGDLGRHTLAILLPETDGRGLESFMKRVGADVAAVGCSTAVATYPHALFDELARGAGQDLSRSQPLLVDQPRKRPWMERAIKRGIDAGLAALGLIALSPLMAATAAAIAMTSPGPVIFRQVRLGKGGAPFVFYKFRSMAVARDDRVHREYVIGLITAGRNGTTDAPAQPWAKLKSDSRITPVGRFIRRTSIDELPQLFNVLKGDLSLIGPRPPVPYEAEKYESWHLRRVLDVRPGISGLWQVEAGYNATFDDMVRLDLRYAREQSLLLDFKILLRTVQVVLRGDGAG